MVFLVTLIASMGVCDVLFCHGALQRGCEAVARVVRRQWRRAALQLATDDRAAAHRCHWE